MTDDIVDRALVVLDLVPNVPPDLGDEVTTPTRPTASMSCAGSCLPGGLQAT